ncbi:MAG: DUF951 domain-containing protein [Armatimonadetes bacterium]|nr:DUF951 domain-containing protein [Armatimonadota bacterium]
MGQTVALRKAHACGGRQWRIVRVGADIGVVCETCGRRVLLPRDEFDRAARTPPLSSPRQQEEAGGRLPLQKGSP